LDYRDIIAKFLEELDKDPEALELLRGQSISVWTRVICDYANSQFLAEVPRDKLYRQIYSWLKYHITERKPVKDKEDETWYERKLKSNDKAFWISERRFRRIESDVIARIAGIEQ